MRKLRSRVAECGDESDKVVEPETEAASPGKLARVAGLPAKIRRTQEETSWDPQPLKLTEIYPPGDLPHPGIEPTSSMSPALAGGLFTTSTHLLRDRKSVV